jgi:hypothetical protein
LRLAMMAYEVHPSGMILGMLVFAPFVIGIVTACTWGWGGAVGLLGLAVIAARLDVTPKIKLKQPPPLPRVPPVPS